MVVLLSAEMRTDKLGICGVGLVFWWCRLRDEGAQCVDDADELRELVRQVWGSEHTAVPDRHL